MPAHTYNITSLWADLRYLDTQPVISTASSAGKGKMVTKREHGILALQEAEVESISTMTRLPAWIRWLSRGCCSDTCGRFDPLRDLSGKSSSLSPIASTLPDWTQRTRSTLEVLQQNFMRPASPTPYLVCTQLSPRSSSFENIVVLSFCDRSTLLLPVPSQSEPYSLSRRIPKRFGLHSCLRQRELVFFDLTHPACSMLFSCRSFLRRFLAGAPEDLPIFYLGPPYVNTL